MDRSTKVLEYGQEYVARHLFLPITVPDHVNYKLLVPFVYTCSDSLADSVLGVPRTLLLMRGRNVGTRSCPENAISCCTAYKYSLGVSCLM